MRYGNWKLYREALKSGAVRYMIRRWIMPEAGARRYERLKSDDERFMLARGNEAELEALVLRLNDADEYKAQRAKKRVKIDHAYINDDLLEEYRRWRFKRTGGSERIVTEVTYIEERVLPFFVGKLGLPNPKDWRLEAHQDAWWESMSDLAPATRVDIVGCTNRFIGWLRERRGTAEIPEFRLAPVSRQVLKRELANHRVATEDSQRSAITEAEWEGIRQAAKAHGILPHVMLGFCFGLRRSEILGIKSKDATPEVLVISRTLKCMKPLTFEATKSAESRRVPYWYATQAEALAWISEVEKARMDPDTLTALWGKIGSKRSIHELRHTFITRAAKDHNIIRVQRASGHADINTTMRYVHDLDDVA